mmetsp:Transcript_61215/g.186883  ORF Transcript_61215/g.186883 Transcript_61215/m.186883 type:complete len:363 (+) Transcript_61215:694-1782(+)
MLFFSHRGQLGHPPLQLLLGCQAVCDLPLRHFQAILYLRGDDILYLHQAAPQGGHLLRLREEVLLQRGELVLHEAICLLPVRPLNLEHANLAPPMLLVLHDAGLDVLSALFAHFPQHLERGRLVGPSLVGLVEQRVLQRADVLHGAVDDAAQPGNLLFQCPVLLGPAVEHQFDSRDLGVDLSEPGNPELRLGVQLVLGLLEALLNQVGHALPHAPLLCKLGLAFLEEALHLDDHPPRVGLQIPELLLDDAQLLRERARLLADELPLDRQQLSLLLVVELHLPVPLSLPPVQCGDARGVLGRGHRLLGGHPAAQRDARARDGQGRRQGRRFRCGGPWLWRRVRHPAPRRRLERLPQRLPQRLE